MFENTRKTKIVATIGPASYSEEILEDLINAGANIFRFNMKHDSADAYRDKVITAQNVIKKLNANVGILFDLQGPDIRIDVKDKEPIELKKGDKIYFGPEFLNKEKSVKISHTVIFEELDVKDTILIDDGLYEFRVVEKKNDGIVVEALEDCVIKNRKGINIPSKKLSKIPSLTKDDLDKLDLAAELSADFIAISFCRSKKDILDAKKELKKRGLNAWIVSKVENQEGLNNIDEIIEESDAIMIARGDLGIEIPIERIANVQKMMAYKCRQNNKPVITATQMLESMIVNPRPTRAEATDVSNAVLYGTDAVMLSGETAAGKYPVKCVKTMAKIVDYNEEFVPMLRPQDSGINADGISQLLARTAVAMVEDKSNVAIDKIVVFTDSGFTAKVLASYRLNIPVIAVTDNVEVSKFLTLSYGVNALCIDFNSVKDHKVDFVLKELKDSGYVKTGESLLLVSGRHLNMNDIDNSIRHLVVK